MRKTVLSFLISFCLLVVSACSQFASTGNEAESHYLLGVSYLQEGNYALALRELLEAEKLDPQRADTQNALGQAFHGKRAYPEAEKHFMQGLELSGNDPDLENNLAALYLDMERWDDAILHFRRAATNLLFQRPEIALTGACVAHFQKGEYIEAVAACKEAVSVNAQYPPAHLYLGQAYSALNKAQLAVDEYQKALSLFPNYLQARFRLGLAYLKLRQKEKAAEELKQVLDSAPGSELAAEASDYLKLIR